MIASNGGTTGPKATASEKRCRLTAERIPATRDPDLVGSAMSAPPTPG